MKIPLPRLPPPQTVANELKPLRSLGINALLLLDLPPPWIGLLGYPSGIVDRLNIEHRTYRLPYYGKTIEVSYCRRKDVDSYLSTTRAKVMPLLYSNETNTFGQYRPTTQQPQKVITKIMAKTATNKPAASAAAPTKTPKDAAPEKNSWVQNLLQPSYKDPLTGIVAYCGFLLLNVDVMLKWLTQNIQNRPINWKQIETLRDNWLTNWVATANLWCIDWRGIVADSQHRAISFVLAFGNFEQVRKLMLLLTNTDCTYYEVSPEQAKTLATGGIDPVLKVIPIANYTLNTKGLDKDYYVPCVVNCTPEVAEMADQDAKARTGGDQLARNSESGSHMSKYGLNPDQTQEILRHIWLRVNPPTAKEEQGGARYGTLKKGGKPKPSDYPVFFGHVKASFVKAMEVFKGIGEFVLSPLSVEEIIATLILAYEGGVSEAKIKDWLSQWCKPWTKVNGVDTCPTFEGLPKMLMRLYEGGTLKDKDGDPIDDPRKADRRYYVYAASYALTQLKGGNSTDFTNLDKLLDTLDKKDAKGIRHGIEQNPLCRLPGADSTGDPRFVSASLKKKLGIERRKLKLETAEPPKKKGPKPKTQKAKV